MFIIAVLERVKIHVIAARPDVCLISDMHAGILQSILKLQRGTATTPPLWPDVQNRWCIRHMGANFYEHFLRGCAPKINRENSMHYGRCLIS